MIETTPTPSAVIFAGGDPIPADEMPRLPDHRFVIAADGGLHAAQSLGIAVDLVIGDFDSATPAALEAAQRAGAVLERHPADKDATDLELALDACLDRGLSPTVVVGGSGFDRIDHFMANALLLGCPRYAAMRTEWWVKGARVTPVHDRIRVDGAPGDLLTLLPIRGTASGITTTGLRWPLQGATLQPGSTRGVSNEMIGPTATVRLEQGTLLAIHTGGSR